ncbi:MAG: hypothetical protein ACSLFH_15230 [Desulfuromonadales bacterium]
MLNEYLQAAGTFLHTNPIIAVLIGVIVVVLFYSQPKEMFKLAAFVLFIAVVFYVITLLAGTVNTGSKQKDQMIYKSRDVIGE